MRGWVEKRGDRFRAVYRIGTKRHGETFDFQHEADTWLVQQLGNRSKKVDPRGERTTLGAVWDDYIAVHDGRPRTITRYESLWNNHLRDDWRTVQLRHINIIAVKKWQRKLERKVSAMTGRPLSESTLAGCFVLMYALLTFAVDEATLLTEHPLAEMDPPTVHHPRVVPPPAEDITALLEELPEMYQPVFILEAGCGARFGEAAGVTRKRLDLKGGWVHIDGQVHTVGRKGEWWMAAPKSRGAGTAGIRVVPVSSWAAGPLQAHLDAHPMIGDGFVAHMPDGHPIQYVSYNKHLNAAQVRLWGERRYTGHDLRHFYVSTLLAAGIPLIPDVQRYIGHEPGSAITSRIYAHLVPGADEKVRQAMDAAFAPTVPPAKLRKAR